MVLYYKRYRTLYVSQTRQRIHGGISRLTGEDLSTKGSEFGLLVNIQN